MQNLHIFPTFLADTLAVTFILLLTDLTKSHPACQTNLSIDFSDRKSAPVTGLAMTEALTDHFLMFYTNFLETSLTLIAFGLIPGSIIANNSV